MGLFGGGKKNTCEICGGTDDVFKIVDGYVCMSCLNEYSGFLSDYEKRMWLNTHLSTLKNARELVERSRELSEKFRATRIINGYFFIDENNKLWAVADITSKEKRITVFRYEDVESFNVLQNDETVASGGLGTAVAGGLLFGDAGAVTGGIVGNKKIKKVINKLQIRVRLKDFNSFYINILKPGLSVKSGSLSYENVMKEAADVLYVLNSMLQDSKEAAEAEENTAGGGTNLTDELIKLKNLLDAGVITDTEFQAAKAKLLE